MLGIDRSMCVAPWLTVGALLIACGSDVFSSAAGGDGGPGSGGATGTGGSSAGTSGKGGSSSGAGGNAGAAGRGAASGTLNAGGSPGNGGSSGAAGSSGSAGTGGGTSIGTVTLVLEITGTEPYCDYIDAGCGVPASATHITVLDSARNPVSTGSPLCFVDCATCQMLPCPGGGGPGAPGGPGSPCAFSTPFGGATVPWDGGYIAQSTCSAGVACQERRYATAGNYVAVMCATPGRMESTDAGQDVCVQTGGVQCTEVPFDYPGSGTVTGKLGN